MGGDNNTLISSDNRVFLFHSSPPTELHRSSLNRSDGTNGYGLYSSVRIYYYQKGLSDTVGQLSEALSAPFRSILYALKYFNAVVK
jgi:hypothetical protein